MYHTTIESNNLKITSHLSIALPDSPADEQQAQAEALYATLAVSDEPIELECSAANIVADFRSYAGRHGIRAAYRLIADCDRAMSDLLAADLRIASERAMDSIALALAVC